MYTEQSWKAILGALNLINDTFCATLLTHATPGVPTHLQDSLFHICEFINRETRGMKTIISIIARDTDEEIKNAASNGTLSLIQLTQYAHGDNTIKQKRVQLLVDMRREIVRPDASKISWEKALHIMIDESEKLIRSYPATGSPKRHHIRKANVHSHLIAGMLCIITICFDDIPNNMKQIIFDTVHRIWKRTLRMLNHHTNIEWKSFAQLLHGTVEILTEKKSEGT